MEICATRLLTWTHNIYCIPKYDDIYDDTSSNQKETKRVSIFVIVMLIIVIGIIVVFWVSSSGFDSTSNNDGSSIGVVCTYPFGVLYSLSDPLTGVEYLVFVGKYHGISMVPRYNQNGTFVASDAGVCE